MSGSFNRCKVCDKYIITKGANYCSAQCRKIDTRIYYSRVGLLLVLSLLGLFVGYGIVENLSIIYIGMIVSSVMIFVAIPMYQFYQTTRIDKKLREVYNRGDIKYTKDGMKIQPVYIYLYINRHTEEMIPDEDFSEFA